MLLDKHKVLLRPIKYSSSCTEQAILGYHYRRILAKTSSILLILHTGISQRPTGSSHTSSKSPAALRCLCFLFFFRKGPPAEQLHCLNLHVSLVTGNNAAIAQADPQNIEGLCRISSWMVFLSPGPWGRPDPCAAVAATLQEPAAPAPELSSRHCWYLALRTCHLKVSLRWMSLERPGAAWLIPGAELPLGTPGAAQ